MNFKKLLQVLGSTDVLSTKYYKSLMTNPSLCDSIKRKITMYVKNDKRLSIKKLLDDLRKLKNNKRGRGGAPINPFAVFTVHQSILDDFPDPTIQQITSAGSLTILNFDKLNIVNELPPPPPPPPALKLGKWIGGGAFGDVFMIPGNTSHVYKIMREFGIWDEIKSNLLRFQDINLTLKIPSSLSPDKESLFIDEGTTHGYIMEKKEGSIDSLFKKIYKTQPHNNSYDAFFSMIKAVNIKLEELSIREEPVFIHGDIKLENILYTTKTNANAKSVYDYFIHDLDTVFIKTKVEILNNSIEFKMDSTMIHAHPLLNYFVYDFLPMTLEQKTTLGTTDMATNTIVNWNYLTNIQINSTNNANFGSVFKKHIMTLLGINDKNNLNIPVLSYYDAKINSSSLLNICKKIDLHALNSSLLYFALLESNKIKTAQNNLGTNAKIKLDALKLLKQFARKNIIKIQIDMNSNNGGFLHKQMNTKTKEVTTEIMKQQEEKKNEIMKKQEDEMETMIINIEEAYNLCKIKTRLFPKALNDKNDGTSK